MRIFVINRVIKSILDLVFPKSCIHCGQEGANICRECLRTIPVASKQYCPRCEKVETFGGINCEKCISDNELPVDQLIVSSDYHHPILPKLIHLYKYNFITSLSSSLGSIMLGAARAHLDSIPAMIIPLPLHPSRLRWRGFNQSELLANYLAANLTPGIRLPVVTDLVIRQKNTQPQMKLKSAQQRKENLRSAFILNPQSAYYADCQGKRLLLIDDICTTAATLTECASALKTLQPHSIIALVLARQK